MEELSMARQRLYTIAKYSELIELILKVLY
jgi:hypothetical protein